MILIEMLYVIVLMGHMIMLINVPTANISVKPVIIKILVYNVLKTVLECKTMTVDVKMAILMMEALQLASNANILVNNALQKVFVLCV